MKEISKALENREGTIAAICPNDAPFFFFGLF